MTASEWPASRSAFEQAIEADGTYAEAFFHLGRVLRAEGAQQDIGRARWAVRRAVDLDPENVAYLTAEMVALRGAGWNFFMDMERGVRRRALAGRILALDSLNGFAHEELATAAIRDYYQYRNAYWTRDLRFYSSRISPLDLGAEALARDGDPGNAPATASLGAPPPLSRAERNAPSAAEVRTDDRFDLETLEAYGTSYGGRAERAYEEATGHLRIALESDPRRRPATAP